MKTVLMAIAVVKDEDRVLLRKMDPAKNPYLEPWAIFGGRIQDDTSILDSLNKELDERWNFSVKITEKIWWDDEVKIDYDGDKKRFVYLDIVCSVDNGEPKPVSENEQLEWVALGDIDKYELNPPTKTVLRRLLGM